MKKPAASNINEKMTYKLHSVSGETLDYILTNFIHMLIRDGYRAEEYNDADSLMKSIRVEWIHGYYDDIECEAILVMEPSVVEVEKRKQVYDAKLTAYNKWYDENRTQIQIKEAATAKKRANLAEANRMKKIAKLQKELEKLTKS